MEVTSLTSVAPFTTKDGSTIHELHHTALQSLAQATLDSGQTTQRHYHRRSEEIYFVLEGEGEMELEGDRRTLAVGDAVLIPPGAWHEIRAVGRLRFLCCCAPPYAHEDTYFE
ncbi:MAG TPA: cupin domain-containing protein [Gaiellaceae bacterium]|jgi:mannose-6-phosphate isomerase-like protein (cupin superfamily)